MGRTSRRGRRAGQTAAEDEDIVKSFVRSAGTCQLPPYAITRVVARVDVLEDLYRRLVVTEVRDRSVILPSSIRNTPSRVRPVIITDCGSSMRLYQKRVTRRPFLVVFTSSSIDSARPPLR
jgi:hypothetical protein